MELTPCLWSGTWQRVLKSNETSSSDEDTISPSYAVALAAFSLVW